MAKPYGGAKPAQPVPSLYSQVTALGGGGGSNADKNAALLAKHGGEYGKRGSYGPVDSGGMSTVVEGGYVPGQGFVPGANLMPGGGFGGMGGGSWSGGGWGGDWSIGGGGGSGPSLTVDAQRDANLDQTYNDYRDYRGKLAEGQDQDAVNALMRQRDITSGMATEAGQLRALTSGGPDSGVAEAARVSVLNQGQQAAGQLNANLVAGARSAQLQALSGQGNAASASAAALAQQQQQALQQWQAQQQAQIERARLAQDAQRNAWSQAMQLQSMMYTG